MAHDVFISYAASDKPVADAVCATLESRGIRCWIAPRDVLPGTDWGDSIVRAVHESRAMVLVFSSHANTSSQVKREVNLAIDKEIPIAPFRIENVMPSGSLEYYLDVTHWLDALTPPMEKHIDKLANDVARLLSKDAPRQEDVRAHVPTPPPPPPQPKPINKALLAAAVVGVLALAVVVGVLANKWSGGGNDNSVAAVVTPSPTAPTPTITSTPTPTLTPTLTPTPTPTLTPTPPPPTPTPDPPVLTVTCSPPTDYELRCRATSYRTGGRVASVYFKKAARKAPDGLDAGECAWMDRPIGPTEPGRIDADLGMVQDLLPFLQREDLLFGFCARNAGDHFIISKAARVK